MPNQNTVGRLAGAPSPAQGSLVIPAFVPSGTSAAVVPCQTSSTTAAVLTVGNAAGQPTGAQTYGSGFDGLTFKLAIAGKVTTKASCNVTVAIQQGNNTTVTSGNTVCTTGAKAVNTASAGFRLEAIVNWDSTSQVLGGWQIGQVNNSLVSAAALTNAVSVTSQANLQFVPVVTFSDTTSGTTMTITEFTAEQI